ncbi:MAG: LysR family transcriptional regulator [Rubrivivax sp.]|nr:LysR family transcriptional regulator [Rubrivivax sp.]
MPRPLDPVSLQHYVAVCEEGNIARAAARECLVPSALSKRLAALEAEVGVPLLVRHRRGVEPTAAGEALLVRAREVLSGLDLLRVELSAYSRGVQGSVRVLASPSVLAERLPDDVGAFGREHPGLQISLDERMSPEIVRGVREGNADLGVLWDRVNDLSGLHARPYRSDRLCVAMAPDHPLARRASLRHEDTLDQPSINIGPGGQMDQLLRRQAALVGRVPTHRMQVSQLDAACRLVGAGLGLAILPLEAAVPHGGAGRLAFVPLAEPWAERRFVIVSRAEPRVSAAARLLADHLQQVARRETRPRRPAARR